MLYRTPLKRFNIYVEDKDQMDSLHLTEMNFSEFIESVVVLAMYKYPGQERLAETVETFIIDDFAGGIKYGRYCYVFIFSFFVFLVFGLSDRCIP